MNNSGWICPQCHAVMSPTYPTCFYCKPVEDTLVKDKLAIPPQPKNEWLDKLTFPVASKCIHEWDYSRILTSNPPKVECKKCHEYKTACIIPSEYRNEGY